MTKTTAKRATTKRTKHPKNAANTNGNGHHQDADPETLVTLSANDFEPGEPAGPGRPPKYLPQFARIAEAMCRLGATDAELAAAFGVETVTIWRWQSTHEDFCNALIAGKGPADNRVERSLYQRAVGYTFDTEKLFSHQGAVTRARTVEHVPPDPGAAKLWLCNRRPDDWRDTAKVEVTGKNGAPLQIEATAAIAALIEAMPELLSGKLLDGEHVALASVAAPVGEERS